MAAHEAALKSEQDAGSKAYSKSNPLKLGIMSTANIAKKVIAGVHSIDNVEAYAVASRSLEKAEAFAKETGVTKAYASYEELLDDKDIEAVYVPLPTSLHAEWVEKIAKAGKHILCEKPCAITGEELYTMLAACKENNVHFMDNVMFMHHDRLRMLLDRTHKDQFFGPNGITHVSSTFSFRSDEDFYKSNIRMNKDLDSLGALGDLGWYNLRIALFAFGWRMPATAQGTVMNTHEGVPIELSATLTWEPEEGEEDIGGVKLSRSTTFYCSFLQARQQSVFLSGAKGMATMDDFVNTRSPKAATWEEESEAGTTMTEEGPETVSKKETKSTGPCRQEALAVENFARQILACKDGKPITFWPRVALLTQVCIDSVLESIEKDGAVVKVDSQGLVERFDSN